MTEATTPQQQEVPPEVAKLIRLLGEKFSRENTVNAYANNTRFEPSVWDIKILFGQLKQHAGSDEIDWHTIITMPWLQAKLLVYYLRLNLAFHEKSQGPLKFPAGIKPNPPERPTEEQLKNDIGLMELLETYTEIYSEMFGG